MPDSLRDLLEKIENEGGLWGMFNYTDSIGIYGVSEELNAKYVAVKDAYESLERELGVE